MIETSMATRRYIPVSVRGILSESEARRIHHAHRLQVRAHNLKAMLDRTDVVLNTRTVDLTRAIRALNLINNILLDNAEAVDRMKQSSIAVAQPRDKLTIDAKPTLRLCKDAG